MAIARLSMKLGKRGKGGSHADYIMRQGDYAQLHDKFEKLEAVVDGNMPTWAVGDQRAFFEASDAHERANAKYSYREMELALPRELTPEQRLELMEEWCEQELPSYPFLYAIHTPQAMSGGDQPHAHLMFSERENDGIERGEEHFFKRANSKHPERGGARKTYNLEATKAERQNRLTALRYRWQEHVNEHLARAGQECRIDMRSYADQGIDKEAQPKMSPRQAAEKRRRMEEADETQQSALAQGADAQAKASEYIREKQEAKAAQERAEREAAAKAAQEQAEREAAAKERPQHRPEPPQTPPDPSAARQRIDATRQEPRAAKERGANIAERMLDVQLEMRTAAEQRDSTAKVAHETAAAVSAAQAEVDAIRGLFKRRERREAQSRLDAAQERHQAAQEAAQEASGRYVELSREAERLRERAAAAASSQEPRRVEPRIEEPAPAQDAPTQRQPQRSRRDDGPGLG